MTGGDWRGWVGALWSLPTCPGLVPHPCPALRGIWLSPEGTPTLHLQGQAGAAPQFLPLSTWTLSRVVLTRPTEQLRPRACRRGRLHWQPHPATQGTGARGRLASQSQNGGQRGRGEVQPKHRQAGQWAPQIAAHPSGVDPTLPWGLEPPASSGVVRIVVISCPVPPGGAEYPQHTRHAHAHCQPHVLLFLLVFNPLYSI